MSIVFTTKHEAILIQKSISNIRFSNIFVKLITYNKPRSEAWWITEAQKVSNVLGNFIMSSRQRFFSNVCKCFSRWFVWKLWYFWFCESVMLNGGKRFFFLNGGKRCLYIFLIELRLSFFFLVWGDSFGLIIHGCWNVSYGNGKLRCRKTTKMKQFFWKSCKAHKMIFMSSFEISNTDSVQTNKKQQCFNDIFDFFY